MRLWARLRDHCRVWGYRHTLERDRARTAVEIADCLRADPNANVVTLEHRLHLLSNLVNALQPIIKRSFHLGAAVMSIALALLLLRLPLPGTTVVAKVDADAVRFKLAADWVADVGLLLATPIHLDGLSELMSPGLFKGIQSAGGSWLDIPATVKRISLDHLRLEKGTLIELERLGPALNVYLTGPARGRLTLSGLIEGKVGQRDGIRPIEIKRQVLRVPEHVEFRAHGGSIVPVMLPTRPDLPWVIRGMQIDGVSFSRETSSDPGQSSFKSSITSGTILLYDVNESFELAAFDSLSLETFTGTVFELQGDPSDPKRNMQVTLKGTASRVLRGLGDSSTPKDLTPSLLKYLYHQKSNALLALGIPWLWLMLAGLRKVIFP